MVRIARLVWDEWNEDHIARHGVNPEAVEEVAGNNPQITRARHGTYRLIGQTNGGRFLIAVVAPRGGGAFYVVTARDADAEAFRRR